MRKIRCKNLENELLIAAVDHINDNRYHTYAPLNLEIKPDYFTDGIKILATFGANSENNSAAEINVAVPDLKNVRPATEEEILPAPEAEIYIAKFTIKDKVRETELVFGGKTGAKPSDVRAQTIYGSMTKAFQKSTPR